MVLYSEMTRTLSHFTGAKTPPQTEFCEFEQLLQGGESDFSPAYYHRMHLKASWKMINSEMFKRGVVLAIFLHATTYTVLRAMCGLPQCLAREGGLVPIHFRFTLHTPPQRHSNLACTHRSDGRAPRARCRGRGAGRVRQSWDAPG